MIWVSPDREIKASGYMIKPGHLHVTSGASKVVLPKDYNIDFDGFTGKDMRIAFIDSGIDKDHDDLENVKKMLDFTPKFEEKDIEDGIEDKHEGKDHYGHGTHVAGLAVGVGKRSYEHKYRNYIAGIAPESEIYNLRVLDRHGAGRVSYILEAIDWVIEKYEDEKIRVVNLSVGMAPMSSYKVDPLAVACAEMVRHGLVVVAAAGNYGDYEGEPAYGGITSPANSPFVIAVGAADTQGTDIRSDDTVAPFSSKGPTLFDGLPKPDLIAPGVMLKSTNSKKFGLLYRHHPETGIDPCDEGSDKCGEDSAMAQYQILSGTSMAAPIVSGTVALMLQANPSLTPNAVKAILMGTAQILPDEPYIHQGAGLLNVEGAVRLAANTKDLSEVEIGADWTISEMEPVSEIEGEQIVWSQGVGWTGFTLTGIGVVFTYQPVYAFDAVWGQGVGWTGITFGIDPVFNVSIRAFWDDSLVNPMSLPYAGEDVLVEQSVDWEDDLEFIDENHPAFPTQE